MRSAVFSINYTPSPYTPPLELEVKLEELADSIQITLTGADSFYIKALAFDVNRPLDGVGTPLGITTSGSDVNSFIDYEDNVSEVDGFPFSGNAYDFGVLFNSFDNLSTFTVKGITFDELAQQRFTAVVGGILDASDVSFSGTSPVVPAGTPKIEASLKYVLPASEEFIYQRLFDQTPNDGINNFVNTVFIQPDSGITQTNSVKQRATIKNTGTVATTSPIDVFIASDNPYLALYGVDIDGNGTADSSNDNFIITPTINTSGSQTYKVTILRNLAPGEEITIDGLLDLENREDSISQLPFSFEFVDANGNVVYKSQDVNFYLSSQGFSKTVGSSQFSYAQTETHKGALSIGGSYADTTTGDDSIEAFLPRVGGSLEGNHKFIALDYTGDVDLVATLTPFIRSNVIDGQGSWAWYTPPGVDINTFIGLTGSAAHNELVSLLPTLGDVSLATPTLTKDGVTVKSQFQGVKYNPDGTTASVSYNIRSGEISSSGSPSTPFKAFTYNGTPSSFQKFYEDTAKANPNTDLKFVITSTAPLDLSNYSSTSPFKGSEIVVLEFRNSTQASFQTKSTGEYVDFSKMVIANKNGEQIGIKYTGDNKNNNVRGDKVIGTNYADSIIGGNGSDQLIGFAGNDFLSAGNGGDTVWGGVGSDTIDLGNGSQDTVIFTKADLGTGTDIIKQFGKNQDKIGLVGLQFIPSGRGNGQTQVYQSGNKLMVGSQTLAVLENFSGTLTASNFVTKGSVSEFFPSIPSEVFH